MRRTKVGKVCDAALPPLLAWTSSLPSEVDSAEVSAIVAVELSASFPVELPATDAVELSASDAGVLDSCDPEADPSELDFARSALLYARAPDPDALAGVNGGAMHPQVLLSGSISRPGGHISHTISGLVVVAKTTTGLRTQLQLLLLGFCIMPAGHSSHCLLLAAEAAFEVEIIAGVRTHSQLEVFGLCVKPLEQGSHPSWLRLRCLC